MDAIRRTSTLRRVATTASLAAFLLVPAHADAKTKKVKLPVIRSVRPLTANVGDTLTITGRNFRKGKGKNSVGFKRSGAPVVFVKSDLSTLTKMTVKLPNKLEQVLVDGNAARFSLRVLARRFGKQYTSKALSPMIGPRPPKPDPGATPDPTPTPQVACDAPNPDADKDGDLLSNGLEEKIGTGSCDPDSDDDGISDGYEYRSAIDLNDDEYQNPNQSLPYPGKTAYPNPLSPADRKDDGVDYDGDGLTLLDEYNLWMATTPEAQRSLADVDGAATPLSYSDGLQYSRSRRCVANDSSPLCATQHVGRRIPTLAAANYDKWTDFINWTNSAGYNTVYLHDSDEWFDHSEGRHPYSILDVNRDGTVDDSEKFPLDRNDNGWLSDDERDEDADGLSNITESHIEMRVGYWNSCYESETPYPVVFDGLSDLTKADSDGDGVRDGADDQDHDDLPNIMELSRYRASGDLDTEDFISEHLSKVGKGPLCKPDADLLKAKDDPDTPQDESAQPFPLNHADAYGQVNPFNPCLPDTAARSCAHFYELGTPVPAPFDDSPHWWALQ